MFENRESEPRHKSIALIIRWLMVARSWSEPSHKEPKTIPCGIDRSMLVQTNYSAPKHMCNGPDDRGVILTRNRPEMCFSVFHVV